MFGIWFGDAMEFPVRDACFMAMNAGEEIERGTVACSMSLCLQAHAHDAVEHESEKADQRMGADAARQSVVHRGNLDVGHEVRLISPQFVKPYVKSNKNARIVWSLLSTDQENRRVHTT